MLSRICICFVLLCLFVAGSASAAEVYESPDGDFKVTLPQGVKLEKRSNNYYPLYSFKKYREYFIISVHDNSPYLDPEKACRISVIYEITSFREGRHGEHRCFNVTERHVPNIRGPLGPLAQFYFSHRFIVTDKYIYHIQVDSTKLGHEFINGFTISDSEEKAR